MAAFPSARLEPVAQVTDDHQIAMAYTLIGTHYGDTHGVAATGKRIEVRGLQISRVENGQIVERWGSTDELGILRQLGAAPETGHQSLTDQMKGHFKPVATRVSGYGPVVTSTE